MTTSKHTATPFFIDTKNFDIGKSDNAYCSIRAQGDSACTPWHIAEVLSSGPHPKQDAAFIVQAVNSHDSLVEALEQLVAHIHLDTLDVRKDFSLLVARAGAVKALHAVKAES